MDTTLRERFRFMLDHAGYSTPPGRAVCALELARAEDRLEQSELEVVCEPEPNPFDFGPASDGSHDMESWRRWWVRQIEAGELAVVTVALRAPSGEIVASLGGVDTYTNADPYRRVVAAELASEYFTALDTENVERAEWEARDTVTI